MTESEQGPWSWGKDEKNFEIEKRVNKYMKLLRAKRISLVILGALPDICGLIAS